MSKAWHRFYLLLTDFLLIHLAFFVWAKIRWSMGFFAATALDQQFILSMIVYVFWLIIFIFYGLYEYSYTRSRVDEFFRVVKVVSIGLFVIFLITFDADKDFSHPLRSSRLMILSYWVLLILLVGAGRVGLRTIRRWLLEKGIGRRNALIVGWGTKAQELFDMVRDYPALGYDVVGFVHHEDDVACDEFYESVPVVASLNHLHEAIQKACVQDILIALPRRSEKRLEEIISQCDGAPVELKIVPDHYDLIIGHVKTNQLYGFPLIEISHRLMEPWEEIVKRMIDIGVSVIGFIVLLALLPLWAFFVLWMQIKSPGPLFYTQERVGKNGKLFKIYKFRTMIRDAEKHSGPVWATDDDPRIPKPGLYMRKYRIDEIPQLINILDGDMSLIGPRPERPFFVEKLKHEIPLYTRRLRIRPGLTGWAQVKGDYDQTIEDVKKKLEFDLFYIDNMSIRMDIKIMINTAFVMLSGKGK